MLQFFKQIYLTAFTIFFRVGGADWTPGINAGKGVAGVAMIEWLILIGTASWIDVFEGRKFLLGIPKWISIVLFLALCALNHYPLVVCGYGTHFQHEFAHLRKSRKLLLLASCALVILGAIAFFICAARVHRNLISH